MIIKRERENVPEGTEREDSLVAENTRAEQMTQLPGAREEMTPPSQLTTPMGEISPGESNEQENVLGRPEHSTGAEQMERLPCDNEERAPPSERNMPAGIKEQEDMLGRPEGQPKMREKECAPEGVHDQQEDLLHRVQTTRECVPEGMRKQQEDLFHRNLNAPERDKVDDDTRTPTETRRYREPKTAKRAAKRRTRKGRGKERGDRVVGRGSACKLRRTTRPKRARARERQKQADDPLALPWSRFLTAKFL